MSHFANAPCTTCGRWMKDEGGNGRWLSNPPTMPYFIVNPVFDRLRRFIQHLFLIKPRFSSYPAHPSGILPDLGDYPEFAEF